MRRRRMLGGAIAAALGGAGCSVLPSQPYLQRRDWPLEAARPSMLPPRQGGRVLLVRSIQAAPGLEARGLSVLQPDGSVRTDFYEQWAVPPAQAVDDDLRRWLAASGLFAGVLASGSRLPAELVLEGELTALHADLGIGTARAALALVLIDQQPSPARILLARTVSASIKLAGTDPPSLVRAQVAAVASMLRLTEEELAASLHA
jgi:cholesterol transport system auxiliary component